MKEIYVVTSGKYSDYGIVKIFENIEDAEQFCAIHNDAVKPHDDLYYLEIFPVYGYGEKEKIQTYKALSCQVIECDDTIPSTVKIINIETQFSKKPFNKSFKHKDSWMNSTNGKQKMMSLEFDRSFGIIEPEQIEIVKSEYGNRYVSITPEDILALITGKVLFVEDGEYTTFVKLTE